MFELIIAGIAAVAGVGGLIYAALQYHRRDGKQNKFQSKKLGKSIPRQSPSFVGREKEIKDFLALLRSRVFLFEITGLGGIGKTALAIEVARQCLKQKVFNEVIWISAKYQLITLDSLLSEILSAFYRPTGFDVPIPEGVEVAKNILSRTKTLLVIDNYEEITDDRIGAFLRELPQPSKAIVTTRHASLDAAGKYELKGLPLEDAKALAQKQLQLLDLKKFGSLADQDLSHICTSAHGVPFVIIWFLGQIKAGQSWEVLLSGLETANLAAEELYDYIFKKTFQTMTEDILNVLVISSLFRNPILFEDLVFAVNEAAPELVSRCIAQWVDQSLFSVEPSKELKKKFYAVHPLTRNYVIHLIYGNEKLEGKASEFYLHILERAKQDAKSGSPSFPFLGYNVSTAMTAIEWFEDHMQWDKVVDLQQALSRFLWVRGKWTDRISLGEKALKAARFVGNKEAEAAILMDDLGWTTYASLNYVDKAYTYLTKAKELYDKLKKPHGQVKVRRHLAAIARNNGDLELAKILYQEATDLVTKIDDELKRREMDASLQVSQGKLAWEEKYFDLALKYFDGAIELFKLNNDPLRAVKALNFKARVLISSRNYQEAKDILSTVIEQSETLERVDQIALAFELLAEIYIDEGNKRLAKKNVEEATKAYSALGDHKSLRNLKSKWPLIINSLKQ